MRIICLLILGLTLFSCVPRKNMVYLQNIPKEKYIEQQYNTKIKPDDLLHISIQSVDSESSSMFNLGGGLLFNPSGIRIGFLVDREGYLDYPLLGKLYIKGLTIEQFKKLLSEKLKNNLLNEFYIDVRFINFYVNIIGEVNQPGVLEVPGERITVLEAIAKRGDLSIFGDRKNILIMRERDNQIVTYKLDITKSDFIDSDFYYLEQNDVVYIPHRDVKANNTAISSNFTTTISILTSLLTLYLLIDRTWR